MKRCSIYFNKEFLVFVACGGFSAIFNLLSRIWLNNYMSYAAAIALSYIVGMIIAFSLNRVLVFQLRNPCWKDVFCELGKFILVNCFSLMQTLLISLIFREIIFTYIGMTFYPSELAHFVGLGSTTFTSFIGHKYFTFKRKRNRDDE